MNTDTMQILATHTHTPKYLTYHSNSDSYKHTFHAPYVPGTVYHNMSNSNIIIDTFKNRLHAHLISKVATIHKHKTTNLSTLLPPIINKYVCYVIVGTLHMKYCDTNFHLYVKTHNSIDIK